MSKAEITSFLILLFVPLHFLLCAGEVGKGTVERDDWTGPTIEHEPVTSVESEGVPVIIEAKIYDSSGVLNARLFYRRSGDEEWHSEYMSPYGGEGGYVASIDEEFVTSRGTEYYLYARDASSNNNISFHPEDAPSQFHSFSVHVETLDLPLSSDFETESLEETGWKNYSIGFYGYGWKTIETDSYSGERSAYHSDGIPEIPTLRDYLVSPPLNFDVETDIEVIWFERGLYTDRANHSLLISIGSRDPAYGDFVQVGDPLPPPSEGEWGRSSRYSLDEYRGYSPVYLAFYYEGNWADEWFIDSVYIGEPSPYPIYHDYESIPSPIMPGDTAEIIIWIKNDGGAPTGDLSGRLSTTEQGFTVIEEERYFGVINPDEVVSSSEPFIVQVGEEIEKSRRYPFDLVLSDEIATYNLELEILIGYPSTLTISLDHENLSDIEVIVGRGPVDSPDYEVLVAGVNDLNGSGPFDLSYDLTGNNDILPPYPGVGRWFVTISDYYSGCSGQITSFTIEHDGILYSSLNTPVDIPDGEEMITIYIPSPAEFDIERIATSPETVSPGDMVSLVLYLSSSVNDTEGAVSGTIFSSSPDVTLFESGPFNFSDEPIPPASIIYNETAFRFQISSNHKDNTPIPFTLTLEDGVDTWDVPFEIEVPYPVVDVLSFIVDETSGDGDDALEEGETGEITVTIMNSGGLETSSPVTGELSISESSVAEASIDIDTTTFYYGYPLYPGGTGTSSPPFALSVTSGNDGDPLLLDLTITDTVDTWIETLGISLGEVPWIQIDTTDDPSGDAMGYQFDIKQHYFRLFSEHIEFRIDSHTSFSTSNLFLDIYLYPFAGAYILRYIYGTPYFWSFDMTSGNWSQVTPAPPSFNCDDSYSDRIIMGIDLSELAMYGNYMYVGAVSGICGSDYCDFIPDSFSSGYLSDMTFISW